jgi:SPP1 family predicted phage head-tail adaptor
MRAYSLQIFAFHSAMPAFAPDTSNRPRLVQIQRNAAGQDSFGTATENWQTIAKAWVVLWATPKTNAGKELLAALQIKSQLSEILTIRWMKSVTVSPKDRVAYDTAPGVRRILDINAVVNVNEQNQWLELYCQEAT